jgi:hypothetical protein
VAKEDGHFRVCSQSNEQHARFVRKNKQLALAETPIVKDQRGLAITVKTCKNCDKRVSCAKKKTIVITGSVSIGADDDKECVDWKEIRSNIVRIKEQKALLKQFSKNLRKK